MFKYCPVNIALPVPEESLGGSNFNYKLINFKWFTPSYSAADNTRRGPDRRGCPHHRVLPSICGDDRTPFGRVPGACDPHCGPLLHHFARVRPAGQPTRCLGAALERRAPRRGATACENLSGNHGPRCHHAGRNQCGRGRSGVKILLVFELYNKFV